MACFKYILHTLRVNLFKKKYNYMVLIKLGSTFIFLNSTFDACSFCIIKKFFVGLVIFVWHGEKLALLECEK